MFEIQGNPETMQFTYCAPNREATAQYLAAYAARFAQDGFAPWIAVLKADNRVVGWGGLNRDPKAPHWGQEISYFIHPAYWGRGLATELVTVSLELAFRELRLAEVGAFTKPQNHASSRVLRKVGFSFVRHVPELERDHFLPCEVRLESVKAPNKRVERHMIRRTIRTHRDFDCGGMA